MVAEFTKKKVGGPGGGVALFSDSQRDRQWAGCTAADVRERVCGESEMRLIGFRGGVMQGETAR
jgi:hypothetical protein